MFEVAFLANVFVGEALPVEPAIGRSVMGSAWDDDAWKSVTLSM